jgi:prepilin-type N-terminal cleavage/methylation domain-containing protein
MKKENKKGFSLLEVILSLGIIVLITGISVSIYQSYQIRNNLDLASFSIVEGLYRAQILSKASKGDSIWGVYATTSKVVVFKGSSFDSRDINFDEENDISETISISGISEIVFDKLTGYPRKTGTILLTAINNSTSSITINSQGMIEY